jgi:hypothetical protein
MRSMRNIVRVLRDLICGGSKIFHATKTIVCLLRR